jgi:hypothetical protein
VLTVLQAPPITAGDTVAIGYLISPYFCVALAWQTLGRVFADHAQPVEAGIGAVPSTNFHLAWIGQVVDNEENTLVVVSDRGHTVQVYSIGSMDWKRWVSGRAPVH